MYESLSGKPSHSHSMQKKFLMNIFLNDEMTKEIDFDKITNIKEV